MRDVASCVFLSLLTLSAGDILGETKTKVLIDAKVVRQTYQRGYEMVKAQVLAPGGDLPDEKSALRPLIDFREKRVHWAEIDKDGTIIAVDNGARGDGWLAVYSPLNPLAQTAPNTLAIDPNPSLQVLAIVPVQVTDRFAGIALIHELSHLWDRATGKESLNPTKAEFLLGEVRAYDLELKSGELLSQGKFGESLRSAPVRVTGSIPEFYHRLIKFLFSSAGTQARSQWEAALGLGKPASEQEQAMRLAYYMTSCALELIRSSGHSPSEIGKQESDLIRELFARNPPPRSVSGKKH